MQPNRFDVKSGRVLLLDILRGIAVLNMVAYHLLYDLVYIFGLDIGWFGIRQSFVWEQFICFTFILVAGISFHLSRKPWKNGLRLGACALTLTVVTSLVIPEEIILFGILHFLGSAILLTWLVGRWFQKIPTAIGLGTALILFILFRNIPAGRIGIPLWGDGTVSITMANPGGQGIEIPLLGEWPMPAGWYESSAWFWLGFPNDKFYSADYFSLLPWLFLFWVGYFGGRWWRQGSEWLQSRTAFSKGRIYRILDLSLGAVGRKSLFIYMLHQPILYGVLLILQKLVWQ